MGETQTRALRQQEMVPKPSRTRLKSSWVPLCCPSKPQLTKAVPATYTSGMDAGRETPRRKVQAIRAIAWALAAALLVALVVRFWRPLVGLVSEQDRLRDWVAGFGWTGPLVLIALQAVQVIVAPLPGQVIGLVSGYLFGALWGTVYSAIGVLLGAWILMTLARKLGRPFVEKVVPPAHLQRFDGLVRRGGPAAFFVLFLIPFVPDDSISILAGLTDIPISLLMILAAIGRLPSLLASAWMGDFSGELTAAQWLALLGGAVALGVPVLAYRRRLEAWVQHLAERVGRGESRRRNPAR